MREEFARAIPYCTRSEKETSIMRLLKLTALGLAAVLTASALAGATGAAAAAKPVTDKKAAVTVTPYDGVTPGQITAKFTKAQISAGRQVRLQLLSSGSWSDVGDPVAMSSSGAATFRFEPSYSAPSQTGSYRAVADPVPGSTKLTTEVLTPSAKSKRLIDQGATWSYHPVAGGGFGSLTVTFSKATYKSKKRSVQLQVLKSGKWSKVGKTVKMSSKGVAVFNDVFTTATDSGQTYRAVAAKYSSKLETATVPATPTLDSPWTSVRDYWFGTDAALNAEWSTWDPGVYSIRKCSVNLEANTVMKDGYATLTLKNNTTTSSLSQAKSAGCPKAQKQTYSNAMVHTAGNFTVKNGIVAARVKFSKSQYMHGGIWLHSEDSAGGVHEIDIIESYGYAGKKSKYSKTTSGVHETMDSAAYKKLTKPKGWEKTYNSGSKLSQTVFHTRKLSSAWFSKYHVVSVEFTNTKLVFRVDGKVTGTLTRNKAEEDRDYSLVMSMLTTDWELAAARKAKKKLKAPSAMKVDWVRVWQK